MSDIFVSYDDVDRFRVRRLVEALEARGWSVWWDHEIVAGDSFSMVIERELEAARCVIVAWTRTSVDSDWVRAEANEGWKRGKLVPVLLDRVDPPMPFGQIQAADLRDWDEPGDPGFAKLIADLQGRIGRAPAPIEAGRALSFARRRTAAFAGGALLVAMASVYYVGSSRPGRTSSDAAGATAPAEAPISGTAAAFGLAEPDEAAGAHPAESPTSLAGHWQGAVTYPDGATFEERFAFDLTGPGLAGTASLRGYGNRRGILDGSAEGNRLTFRTRGQIQLDLFTIGDVSYLYRGFLDGDSLRFSVKEEGTGDPDFGFVAHRITAEQANRIATGGTRPRLSGMTTEGLYRSDHIRQVMASRERSMAACYEAAEYDEVNHEFVDYRLTFDAGGALEQLEMRPEIPTLAACMREVLAAARWGPTDTGEGGTIRLSVDARLPWNP